MTVKFPRFKRRKQKLGPVFDMEADDEDLLLLILILVNRLTQLRLMTLTVMSLAAELLVDRR